MRQSGEKRATLTEGLDCAVMKFYHSSLWYEKVDMTQVACTTSPEEFVNAALFLWLAGPQVCTAHSVIRHENEAFRKRWRRDNHVISLDPVFFL